MLSRAASCILFLAVFVFSLTLSSRAQLISSEIYETEEDLREGLEMGYLTFDQYLELLDMIQSKVHPASKDRDRLFFVPDVTSADISHAGAESFDAYLNQRMASFLAKREKKTGKPLFGRLVWRLYQRLEEGGEAESYLLWEAGKEDRLLFRIEAHQEVNSSEAILSGGDFRVRKRFLKLLLPQYSSELVLGNFDRRIGLGLNLGHHPLFGYSNDSDLKSEDSFLYPVRGRFNGICGESEFKSLSVLIFYSMNKRERIENRIGTFDLSVVNKNMQVGVCISEGELENVESKRSFSDDCRSLHFNLELKPVRLFGEYAMLSNQASALAFDLFSHRKAFSFDFSWWKYDDSFIHPHGGGISNPDYETIHLDNIDFDYRSRQAGERGIFFKSRYRIGQRLSLNFSCSQWRERSYLPDKMKLRVGTGYGFSEGFSFTIHQLWTDYEMDDREMDRKTSSLNLFLSPQQDLDLNLTANYRTSTSKDYGDLRVKVTTKVFSPFDLVLWLKYSDPNLSVSSDGYFSFHVRESLRFLENCFVSAEYITKFYQDESRLDAEAVRVKTEISW